MSKLEAIIEASRSSKYRQPCPEAGYYTLDGDLVTQSVNDAIDILAGRKHDVLVFVSHGSRQDLNHDRAMTSLGWPGASERGWQAEYLEYLERTGMVIPGQLAGMIATAKDARNATA
jgi:hypothetical protein